MKTLLLLAGRSKRFWPLADKTLFPICGKTLAEHQVERLKIGGCRDITLVVGAHNKKEMRRLFPNLTIIEQKDLDLGMRGALLSALPRMKKDAVMIVSGNDVIDPQAFAKIREAATKKNVCGAILAQKVKRYFPGGYLTVKGGRIAGIEEKPGEGRESGRLVNIVAHLHNDASVLLSALKKAGSNRNDGYEIALHSLFKNHSYLAVPYEGAWQPVKYPWDLLPLTELFLSEIKKSSIHSSAKIHPSAVLDDNVVVEEDVRVLPNAVIVGPGFVGARSIIGNNVLIRGSSIGRDSVIGFSTEVKSSVLAGPVWTHMTYLGDSVIGSDVSFGGGCVTGNLRLDEGIINSFVDGKSVDTGLTKLGLIVGDRCRFGIQIGSNPGVKVGAGGFVSGGTFLAEDLRASSFARMKNGALVVSPNRASVSMKNRERYKKSI